MLTNYYFYFLNFESTKNICEQYESSVAYKFSSSASAGEIPISRISTRAFKSSFFRWRSTITELRNSIWAWASSFSSNNLWCMGSVNKFYFCVIMKLKIEVVPNVNKTSKSFQSMIQRKHWIFLTSNTAWLTITICINLWLCSSLLHFAYFSFELLLFIFQIF
jgi:hypothetical protein